MAGNKNDSKTNGFSKDLCDTIHERVEDEIDRIEMKANATMAKVNGIDGVFLGNQEKVGIFELLRNNEKRLKSIEEDKKIVKKRLWWALAILLSLLGICRIGVGVSPPFRTKLVKIVKIIMITEEGQQEKKEEIKNVVIEVLEEKNIGK